jgi:uncharacterized protein DUF4154
VPILIHTRRLKFWLAFVFLWNASLPLALAETRVAPEYKIKAAFLYNFAVLTEWPAKAFDSRKSPLTIAVLGKDPFGRILEETMKGKRISGRKIQIKRYKRVDDLDDCHLLFISSSDEESLKSIFSTLGKRPILTVSEMDHFNHQGGMIWLQKQNDEIKFRIRRSVVQGAGLKLSSKLLALSINGAPKKKGKK